MFLGPGYIYVCKYSSSFFFINRAYSILITVVSCRKLYKFMYMNRVNQFNVKKSEYMQKYLHVKNYVVTTS